MFERLLRGWDMTKASWAVLKLHPKLLILPIASTLALLLMIGSIAASAFAGAEAGYAQQVMDFVNKDNPEAGIIYALAFLFYLVCSFIVIFFNAALVFCALEAFAGREPSLRAGLATALGRLPQILAWAFVAATIGLLLNALQNFLRDRLGFLGALFGGLLELAWAVMTYFVVPVLVVDGVGPIEAVRRSAAILKRTWGESVAGEGGLGIISFLAMLPALLLVVLAASLGNPGNAALLIAIVGLTVLYVVAVSVVFATLGTIFRTSAYIYATTGKAPTAIDPVLVQTAFRRKE